MAFIPIGLARETIGLMKELKIHIIELKEIFISWNSQIKNKYFPLGLEKAWSRLEKEIQREL